MPLNINKKKKSADSDFNVFYENRRTKNAKGYQLKTVDVPERKVFRDILNDKDPELLLE